MITISYTTKKKLLLIDTPLQILFPYINLVIYSINFIWFLNEQCLPEPLQYEILGDSNIGEFVK